MGNNNQDYNMHSTGYDPKAVEYDLQMIKQLTHSMNYSKIKLTMRQAQEIYYRIRKEKIQFHSDIGEEFLLKLYENMTDAQIQEINRAIQRKNQKRQNRKQLLRINIKIACAVSVVVLVASILCINWSLLMDLRTNYQTKKLQEESLLSDGAEHLEQEPSEDEIMLKFTQLYEENPDFVGWLTIPGTQIDYPVVSRAGDNNYYIDKNFEQQYDKNGSLILDYRNDIKNDAPANQNFIIYGHNIKTGVMFGTLMNYKEKSYCEEHMTISFDTLYEKCEYKVVAAMFSGVAYEDETVFRYYDAIDISTEENFNEFQENVISNAIYTTDEAITYGNSYLILSTCDDYKEDGRFVLVAKKV